MTIIPWITAKPAFDQSKDMPNLEGKVIFVTGGTNGLGKQAVLEFARHKPAQLWLAARNPTVAEQTIQEIRMEVPDAPIQYVQLDLASFASIRSAFNTFQEKSKRLDILMLNAGITAAPCGLTDDGYEIQFGTNYLGGVLLTKLLLPTLLATTKKPSADTRVVFLGSEAASMAPSEGILFDSLKTEIEKEGAWVKYGQSKLAVILYARELARRNPELKVSAVHPGFVDTNWAESWKSSSFFLRALYPLMRMASIGVEDGVRNQLWASVSPDVISGTYYVPVGQPGHKDGVLVNNALGARLWEWTEAELEGLH
ncbi:Putative short-chain dehydrogenase/reductase SDR, NAD(P)-binding domain superfamily [Colletotrichum destructivum]|uniref:Short-chain dehydrogenase/reductase SDR, NAD(P)-binding domain superfamily n=1 Tax=Colletotrichum destructivum TaxID=34406 RepID=A0AAX4IXJ1_9PEZI|nr:Putative short-chain dehydrogenase/reductase SDR, NAD(P)-binding domain superfamily [Colletotrichum destructivum]